MLEQYDWVCDWCNTLVSAVHNPYSNQVECDIEGTQSVCDRCYLGEGIPASLASLYGSRKVGGGFFIPPFPPSKH